VEIHHLLIRFSTANPHTLSLLKGGRRARQGERAKANRPSGIPMALFCIVVSESTPGWTGVDRQAIHWRRLEWRQWVINPRRRGARRIPSPRAAGTVRVSRRREWNARKGEMF